ncbi:MAG TPA: YeeE/YedE family protein, partial [Usitatibacter sp.]
MAGSTPHLASLVALGGFALAFVFGAVANRTNFCTMGAVSDVVNMGSWGRMRMWLLAIAVAILGSHALQLAGLIDLGQSYYVRPNFTWLSYLLGGFLFGVGMTLGSGCGSKTLVRMGGGSPKSLVVFTFLGIAAYMTLKGLFAIWRTSWIDPVAMDLATHNLPRQDLPTLISSWSGASLGPVEPVVALVVAGALLAFVFKDREFRGSFDHVLGGVVVGLVVVGG